MSEEQQANEWVVHIVGPDDVIPKSDELDALRSANAVNVAIERERRRYANDPNYPFSIAIAKTSDPADLSPVANAPIADKDADLLLRSWLALFDSRPLDADVIGENLASDTRAFLSAASLPLPSPQSEEIAREALSKHSSAAFLSFLGTEPFEELVSIVASALTKAQSKGAELQREVDAKIADKEADEWAQASRNYKAMDPMKNSCLSRSEMAIELAAAIRAAKQPNE